MANEFIIKNGFRSQGDSEVTGSLSLTGGITGSFSGSIVAPGSDTQVVYNNDGVLGADSGFVYDGGGRINLVAPIGPSYATFQRTGGGVAIVGVDSDTNAYLQADNNIKFITGDGSTKMFISSSGNIGIGTDTPEYALDIDGEARVASSLVFKYLGSDWFRHTMGAGYFCIQNLLDSSFSLTIDSTNHIGINTFSQTAQLQVKGSGKTSATEALRITDTDNTTLFKILDSGQTQVTGSMDVNGSITVNNTNLQSLMIAYSIALG